MAPHVHSFEHGENKVDKLSKWLIGWISISLKNKKIKPFDLLPTKGDLACHIGVSLGTMQNVFRLLEDAGYIESKQKVGSFIRDRRRAKTGKLTSKKDMATDTIKTFLKGNGYEADDKIPSTRKLAAYTGVSPATVRAAVTNLVMQGVLEKRANHYYLTGRSFKTNNIENKTLAEKISDEIKKYIKKELKSGEKLPTNYDFAAMFNVSVKTVHDAVKMLSKKGIVLSRRGKYGTIAAEGIQNTEEGLYTYEKIESKIRKKIASEYNVNDKLPTIRELASEYSTSQKTIKRALDNIAEDGYITFQRGKWGGTFVLEIPQNAKNAYTWLAIDKNYIENQE